MRVLVIILIFLAPISAIAAAIYEIATGKQEPTLYLLLAVIPGAIADSTAKSKTSPPSRKEHKGFERKKGCFSLRSSRLCGEKDLFAVESLLVLSKSAKG